MVAKAWKWLGPGGHPAGPLVIVAIFFASVAFVAPPLMWAFRLWWKYWLN